MPEPHFRNGARVAVSAVDVRAEIPAFPHVEVADAADVFFRGKDAVGVEAHGTVAVKRARQRVPLAVRNPRGPVGIGSVVPVPDVDFPSRSVGVFEGEDKSGVEPGIPVLVPNDGYVGGGFCSDAHFDGEILVRAEGEQGVFRDVHCVAVPFKLQFGCAGCYAVLGWWQDFEGVLDNEFGIDRQPAGTEKDDLLVDGFPAVSVTDATVVGGGEDEPIFFLIIGATRQSGEDFGYMCVNGFNGVDVGRHIGTEPEAVASEVHVVEVQEHGVRVAAREDGASRVGNGLVTRSVDGFINHFALDVVVDGCPVAYRVGIQVRIDGFQSLQEGWIGRVVAPGEIVVGDAVGIGPRAAYHRRPTGAAVRDVVVQRIGAEDAVLDEAIQRWRFRSLEAVRSQSVQTDDEHPRILAEERVSGAKKGEGKEGETVHGYRFD